MSTQIQITPSVAAAGITGQIQFNNAGAFGADSGLFWDNVNKRLGIGATPATTVRLDVRAQGALSTDIAFRVRNSANTVTLQQFNGDGSYLFRNNANTAFSYFDGVNTFQQYGGGATLTNTIGNFTRIQSNAAAVMGIGTESHLLISYLNGNFQFEEISGILQTSGKGALSFKNAAIIPSTNTVDRFNMYSADIVAGNAAPHFRTENGGIIKLYQQATGGGASTFVSNTSLIANDTATFDGYTIGQVVKALRNLGILA